MLQEITALLESANQRYDLNDLKIEAYTEQAIGQLEIDYKKAELQVLKESATDDDLMYLREEAGEGAIEKLKKAIDVTIENFKKFVQEIKLKILVLITKKDTKETVDKAQKKIRFNPFLAKKKIDVTNHKEQMSVIAWFQSELQKILAKIRSGKEVAVDEVSKLKDAFDSRFNKASSVNRSQKITCADAVAKLKKFGDGMADLIENAKKAACNIADDAKALAAKLYVTVSQTLSAVARAATSAGKTAVNAIVAFWKDLMGGIKSAATGIRDKITGADKKSEKDDSDTNDVTESTDVDDMLDDMMTEFASLDEDSNCTSESSLDDDLDDLLDLDF